MVQKKWSGGDRRRIGNPKGSGGSADRPTLGSVEKFQSDPHWRDHLLFHEYFHADTGAGLGSNHQTGGTALVASPHRRLEKTTALTLRLARRALLASAGIAAFAQTAQGQKKSADGFRHPRPLIGRKFLRLESERDFGNQRGFLAVLRPVLVVLVLVAASAAGAGACEDRRYGEGGEDRRKQDGFFHRARRFAPPRAKSNFFLGKIRPGQGNSRRRC